MIDPATSPDCNRPAWRRYDTPYHKLAAHRPDFLVISPPKTGSTWLAANLRCHPGVFVPEVKEVKYFSSYCKWLDIHWYLDHFAPAAGRLKGEASPSYAILPVEQIRLIRRLLPEVKLIFLMRDPIGRAWSHAKHNYNYREANFAEFDGEFETVSDSDWRENFVHEWPLASGDYLGQLRRWLSVFPREQMYVGFYESITTAPDALLRDVLSFLGVSADVDFSSFPLTEKILPGLPGELPAHLRPALGGMLAERTRELASFLEQRFGLRTPQEWEASRGAARAAQVSEGAGCQAAAVFSRDFDDHYLAQVLEHEETFPSSPRLIVEGRRGYNLLIYRGRLYALEQALGRVGLEEMSEADLRRLQERGSCFIASSLHELKERVDQHVFEQAQARLRVAESLEVELRDARENIARLEQRIGQAADDLRQVERRMQKVETDAARAAPLHILAARLARKAARHLREFLTACRPATNQGADGPQTAAD